MNFDDLGVEKDLKKEINSLQGLIIKLGNDLLDDLRTKFDKNKSNASGMLRASMQVNEAQANKSKLIIEMLDYYENVELGQQPNSSINTKTFYPVIRKWMNDKSKYGAFKILSKPMEDVVAMIIVKKIKKYGTKPRPFIKPIVTDKRIQVISDAIATKLAENILKK